MVALEEAACWTTLVFVDTSFSTSTISNYCLRLLESCDILNLKCFVVRW